MTVLILNALDHCKSLLTSFFQMETFPLFEKEGSGEIPKPIFRQL
jgi:hypothetical protein